jgi:hypothetical protein
MIARDQCSLFPDKRPPDLFSRGEVTAGAGAVLPDHFFRKYDQ